MNDFHDYRLWQTIQQDNALHAGVLISVCRSAGSVPREVGARMWWRPSCTLGTIGGGQLEHQALAMAAALQVDLDVGEGEGECRLERFPLAARAGQCCGGTVWLYFEGVPAQALGQRGDRVINLNEQLQWHDVLPVAPPPLYLFGLGHVGQAVMKLADYLPCPLITHDERTHVEDDALTLIQTAVAGSKFLIMTHSHALDLTLCAAVLQRGDAAYCGLIGSASKRQQFIAKLQARGIDPTTLTCPIGAQGQGQGQGQQGMSKIPEHIAIAVAQELINLHAQPIH
ncbi:MAG: hypothetical protein RLZZ502_1310 [Pseudomonadota bacterium]|jgi:xanthine dehydrogenase accessory factor